jgi:uroporphyrinogen decarboxylase
MTRRERVKAAIAHQTPDKTPVFIHLAPDGLHTYNDRLWEKYGREDMRRLRDEGKLENRNALYYSTGNHVCFLENFPWWGWKELPPAYHGEDAPDFIPETVDYGSYEDFAASVRYLNEYTDAYVLVEIWTSDFEKAYNARGIQNFLADMAGDPEFAKKLLDFITEKNLEKLKLIASTPGIDGILLGNDWGSQRDLLMSPATWRELLAPGAKREYDVIREAGLDVWVHSCGNIRQIIPDLIEMGVDVINPVQPECMDIYELKDTFGDKMTFWGGISTQQTLPFGSADEVEAEARRVTEYLGRDGGYLIAAAQGVQADVPFENLCRLIDTANQNI